MRALVLHEDYSREKVHDIFDPDTKFTPQAGTWGLHGIVKIPGRPGDFIFFVTFGRQQADHTFDEGITADGVLRWQSQPKQGFADADIGTLIAHDETKHSIYLFLRTAAKRVGVSTDYTYMGRLKYLVHDRDREKPVYFTWQILDWPLPIQVKERMGLRFEGGSAQAESITGDRREAFGLVETSPPVRSDRRAGVHTPRYIGRLRGDPSEQDAKNRQLGLAGELTVVEHEKRALIAAGREDLAERVVHVSLIEGDGSGYDIKSYTEEGREKFIEVKTTRGGACTAFYVSVNEVCFAAEHADRYYLYRIYDFDESANCGSLFIQRGALENAFDLTAIQFRVAVGV